MNKKNARFGLLIIGLITAFFALQIPKVKFNYDFNAFFPKGDPDLAYYEQITAEFGMYDDFLFVALFGADIHDPAFLQQVEDATHTLEAWPEIERVLSPTNYEKFQITPFGINRVPVYKGNGSLLNDSDMKGLLLARDEGSVCLILQHEFFHIKREGDVFHQKLQNYLTDSDFADFLVSGKVQAQDEFVKRLEQDLGFNLAMAMVLVVIALFVLFKTARGIWIPLLTLGITCLWNTGIYGLLGKELDVLMVIVPPILLIVSMSDIVHLANKFNDLVRNGSSVPDALKVTMREVGLATLLTSITTAIGFLSLALLPIIPIRDFGIYTSLGIILAYLIAFSLIPCLLILYNKPLGKQKGASFWQPLLSRLFIWSIRKHKTVWMLAVSLTVLGIWGISSVKLNTSLLIGIEENDAMAQPVHFFDSQYDGYKPFELTASLTPGLDLFEPKVLRALDSVENYLTKQHGVKHISSPLALIKQLNQGLKGGASSARNLPKPADLPQIKRLFYSSKMKSAREEIQSKDGLTWRMNGRSKDLGSAVYLEKNLALNQYFQQWIKDGLQFRQTGTAFLIDKTNELNVNAILSGLLIAIGVIAALILAFTRNVKLTLISIIPNALPLLLIGGIMGLLKIDLNLSTAIIFSVAFGIAVDDSIHFLSRYVLEIKKGRSNLYALKRSMLSTGKSIIITSLVLFAGFAIFLQSGFSAAYHIGFFVSTTLVLAILADLILLPALLCRKG